jgi:hypothetical protein
VSRYFYSKIQQKRAELEHILGLNKWSRFVHRLFVQIVSIILSTLSVYEKMTVFLLCTLSNFLNYAIP